MDLLVFIRMASNLGLTAVVVGVVAYLLNKLIDKGFKFEMPPGKSKR